MSATAPTDVAWDLEPLVDGDGPRRRRPPARRGRRARAGLRRAHAGSVAELDGAGLAAAVDELAEIADLAGAPATTPRCASARTPPTRPTARCCSACRSEATAIETKLLFFELEWAALDDERAEELLAADGLESARHHLRTARRYRPHLLSEPEEKILAEKAVTGRAAWSRLLRAS